MTSQINPNNIDVDYPIRGQDNDVQGFHDNFGNTKLNFQYAKDEITALQNSSVFTGSATENDLENALLYRARMQDFSMTTVNLGAVSGTVTINYESAHYQKLSTGGSIVIDFDNTKLPAVNDYGFIRLEIYVTNVAHTVTLPTEVDINYLGIQGITGRVITFAAIGKYTFEFTTSDNGSSVTVSEVNKALQPFNNTSEDLAASAAASLAVTASYFTTAAAETATLAAGVEGQIKTFAMYATSGDMVITVANAGWKASGTGTITFDARGDACTLQYINSKWFCIGNNGCVFA